MISVLVSANISPGKANKLGHHWSPRNLPKSILLWGRGSNVCLEHGDHSSEGADEGTRQTEQPASECGRAGRQRGTLCQDLSTPGGLYVKVGSIQTFEAIISAGGNSSSTRALEGEHSSHR